MQRGWDLGTSLRPERWQVDFQGALTPVGLGVSSFPCFPTLHWEMGEEVVLDMGLGDAEEGNLSFCFSVS